MARKAKMLVLIFFCAALSLILSTVMSSTYVDVDKTSEEKRKHKMKTWLFWDWWHVEHQDNVELCQGQPEWSPVFSTSSPQEWGED